MPLTKYPSDWPKRRANVLERDGHECRACGIDAAEAEKKYHNGLHVHHLKPISEGGGHSLDNLVALCEPCHHIAHRENSDSPYQPIEFMTCMTCDREYLGIEGHSPNFCSKRCRVGRELEKAMNHVKDDIRICATCFAEHDRGTKGCDNCGNWDVQERNPEVLEQGDIDWRHLLLRVLYWRMYKK